MKNLNIDYSAYLLFIIIIVSILLLIISEYKDHDCINNKKCKYYTPPLQPYNDNTEILQNIRHQLETTNNYTIWKRALLAALISVVPIVYYLTCRFPSWVEAIIVILIIFVIV